MGIAEIRVGLATCGIAAGAERVRAALLEALESHDVSIPLRRVGCVGMCYNEPLLDIVAEDGGITRYGNLTEQDVERIVDEHVIGGTAVADLEVAADGFFDKQVRIVLENCGLIDPESIDAYLECDGYAALRRAVTEMTPQAVIEEVSG